MNLQKKKIKAEQKRKIFLFTIVEIDHPPYQTLIDDNLIESNPNNPFFSGSGPSPEGDSVRRGAIYKGAELQGLFFFIGFAIL